MTLLPSPVEGEVGEKRVTWAELFFDLVFVFAVTQVTALLHADHDWPGLGRALVIFVPIYWAWVGTSINANLRDVDNPLDRVAIFAIGLCSLFLAMAVPGAYGSRGMLFATSYVVIRLILACLFFHGRRWFVHTFLLSLCVTGPLLLAGGVAEDGWRVGIWAVAALVDVSLPTLTKNRTRSLRFDAHHLPERYGLLVLIALGESIVAIGAPAASAPDVEVDVMVAVAAAFVLACGLWWVYFGFASNAIRHSLETAPDQGAIVRKVMSWAHLSFVAGIIAMAAGISEVVEHPDERLSGAVAGLMFGGVALYLLTFNYSRWQMFRMLSPTRSAAGITAAAMAPLATQVPGVVALCALAAVAILVNLWEHRLVRLRAAAAGSS